jgi:hypothetical protein
VPNSIPTDKTPPVIAARLARKLFAQRGNHSEMHVSEADLSAMLEAAIVLDRQLGAPRSHA